MSSADLNRRRRRIVTLQRFVLNPPVKLIAWLGLLPGHVLLETTGRRTGKRRRVVVGAHRDGHQLWVVAEQGTHAAYVRNLQTNPRVRVRLGRHWIEGDAHLLPGDDPQRRLDTFGMPSHARNVRRFGADLRTVQIDLARSPNRPVT